MTEISRIAVDTSKHVFTLHGVDAGGRAVLRRNLRRDRFVAFFAKLPPLEVALEACGGSHHWGRELTALGHRVSVIPPQYVKPFVKRSKNDRNDAEAISEAAARPGMARVPVKSAEQQAAAMPLSVRELLTKQRTQLVNALRGHAAELGIVAAARRTRASGAWQRCGPPPRRARCPQPPRKRSPCSANRSTGSTRRWREPMPSCKSSTRPHR